MVTQKDIATKLGVSISLVSRVLSGKAREIGIAEETIKQIEDAALKANYVPNSAALNLKGVKTRTLGVVTYDFEDPYFGFILAQLQKMAHKQKYSLILTGAYRRESEHLDVTPFIKHNIEGLIIVGSDRQKTWYEPLAGKKIPSVQIGFTQDKKGSILSPDANKSASLLVENIAKSKCKKVALLFNETLSHETYLHAYHKELKKNNISDTIHRCSTDKESIKASLQKIIKEKTDTIICGDDILALYCIRELHNSGIKVPDDIKVIGFDNIPVSKDFIPSLTTFAPPLEKMIDKAFEVATNHKISHKSYLFTPTLIKRESY